MFGGRIFYVKHLEQCLAIGKCSTIWFAVIIMIVIDIIDCLFLSSPNCNYTSAEIVFLLAWSESKLLTPNRCLINIY